MKVLFIGGTGTISSACSALAVEQNVKLTLFNRGSTLSRAIPPGVEQLHGDIYDRNEVLTLLDGRKFDVVVDWIAFTPEDVQRDIDLFMGKTGQYIFISSVSAYKKPLSHLPISESTLLDNPVWEYSRLKIACEELLVSTWRKTRFPFTIVRPAHTYDKTRLPIHGRYTDIDRMRNGKKIVIPGDGTSLWTLTHHKDFAKGFVGLLGNACALAEAFHISSDEVLTWNQIYTILAHTAGVEPNIVHIPSDVIAAYDKSWGDGLLGEKTYSCIFDNSKIKRVVPDYCATIPFSQGAREIIQWFDDDPDRRIINQDYNHLLDMMIERFESVYPR